MDFMEEETINGEIGEIGEIGEAIETVSTCATISVPKVLRKYGPSYGSQPNVFCNNCGRHGHQFNQCKNPVMSAGVIVFRNNAHHNTREYLMICRRNTLGFVDFVRGKYPIYDKLYLLNIVREMTETEKHRIVSCTFDELWIELWGDNLHTYYTEEKVSRNKFRQLRAGVTIQNETFTIKDIVGMTHDPEMGMDTWQVPEWGFPKGRRNYLEKDYTCAIREFQEETGYYKNHMNIIHNVLPYEEIFIGSNLRCYKHKYYLAYMPYERTINTSGFQKSEVSMMRWMSYSECVANIRHYNREKITVLKNVDATLNNLVLVI